MRDILIKIVKESLVKNIDYTHKLAESISDDLLAEGVIVPPVKVGQTVYCIRYDKARKPFVKALGVCSVTMYGKGGFTVFTTKEDTLGKTVFLSKEEAEKSLEERKEK